MKARIYSPFYVDGSGWKGRHRTVRVTQQRRADSPITEGSIEQYKIVKYAEFILRNFYHDSSNASSLLSTVPMAIRMLSGFTTIIASPSVVVKLSLRCLAIRTTGSGILNIFRRFWYRPYGSPPYPVHDKTHAIFL